MKKIKHRIEDFFKWVNGTELVELDSIDVTEDPVRPELPLDWRLRNSRKIFGLEYKEEMRELFVLLAYK